MMIPINHNNGQPLMIDIGTTCDKLDLSRPSVMKLVAQGKLKSVKWGRRHLINFASVVAFSEGKAA
jgi:excisionase family DNA binding protein